MLLDFPWICLFDAWKKLQTYSPKWWLDGDLPWYKGKKKHLKQIQEKAPGPGFFCWFKTQNSPTTTPQRIGCDVVYIAKTECCDDSSRSWRFLQNLFRTKKLRP